MKRILCFFLMIILLMLSCTLAEFDFEMSAEEMFAEGDRFMDGAEQDYSKAMEWYQNAAEIQE